MRTVISVDPWKSRLTNNRMVRDAEHFKAKIGGLDGAGDAGDYIVKLVKNKNVPKTKAVNPPPPPATATNGTKPNGTPQEKDKTESSNGNGNGSPSEKTDDSTPTTETKA